MTIHNLYIKALHNSLFIFFRKRHSKPDVVQILNIYVNVQFMYTVQYKRIKYKEL